MKKLFLLFSLLILFTVVHAQSELFLVNGEAIRGYDAVSYFKDGKAVKGKKEFSISWNGANWLFASKENKDAFVASPEKYAPQFGGYCAYGTADGHKAPTQPDAWSIVDNKLYLNYNKEVQVIWKKDQKEMIEKANKNWPEVKKQKD
ncbi:MAG TPA: YHS domain-containing (seleno)protein [Cyclobacteriaceae bacterium]